MEFHFEELPFLNKGFEKIGKEDRIFMYTDGVTEVFNDEGVQIAEFDVEVRGKVGTTNIAWLIECRDRPSQGAAPASWVEQLVGRRITHAGFACAVPGELDG